MTEKSFLHSGERRSHDLAKRGRKKRLKGMVSQKWKKKMNTGGYQFLSGKSDISL